MLTSEIILKHLYPCFRLGCVGLSNYLVDLLLDGTFMQYILQWDAEGALFALTNKRPASPKSVEPRE
jgi:hypothetical protein